MNEADTNEQLAADRLDEPKVSAARVALVCLAAIGVCLLGESPGDSVHAQEAVQRMLVLGRAYRSHRRLIHCQCNFVFDSHREISMFQQPLDYLPLWLIFLLMSGVLFACAEIGFLFGKHKQTNAKDKEEKQASTLMGATLGLLAFMLAFTYGASNAIHSERKAMVVEDANAIGTAWLRSQLLGEPYAEEARLLFQEYVEVRVAGATLKTDQAAIQAIDRSSDLLDQLWHLTLKAAKADGVTRSLSLFVEALNEVIDINTKRINAIYHRVPISIMLNLLLISFVTVSMIGYQSGLNGVRTLPSRIGLIIAFSAVVLLIVDLDRPGSTFVSVSQKTMEDLQANMTIGNLK
jgi:hypothetical protein